MKTAQDLRQTATTRRLHLVEHLKRATRLAERLDLNNLNQRDMCSIDATLGHILRNFHEFSAYSNALLTE